MIYVCNLPVHAQRDVEEMMAVAEGNRTIAKTDMNERSSRRYIHMHAPITTPLHTPHTSHPTRTHTHTHTHTHTPACASIRGRAMLDPVPRSASRTVDQTPHE
jgi:hypothetical protein